MSPQKVPGIFIDVGVALIWCAAAWFWTPLAARIIATAYVAFTVALLEYRRSTTSLLNHYLTFGVEPNSNGKLPTEEIWRTAFDAGRAASREALLSDPLERQGVSSTDQGAKKE